MFYKLCLLAVVILLLVMVMMDFTTLHHLGAGTFVTSGKRVTAG
ncbi:hypothetical protein ECDEC2B_0874 [Escherichia coli DEC2B]|nr:hypothetical protein ECDEC2B_0874 [Escherichia coli DEC2B]